MWSSVWVQYAWIGCSLLFTKYKRFENESLGEVYTTWSPTYPTYWPNNWCTIIYIYESMSGWVGWLIMSFNHAVMLAHGNYYWVLPRGNKRQFTVLQWRSCRDNSIHCDQAHVHYSIYKTSTKVYELFSEVMSAVWTLNTKTPRISVEVVVELPEDFSWTRPHVEEDALVKAAIGPQVPRRRADSS